MQCVILAGGLGTRMRPYTDAIPKALIPVNGHPFLHHQLQLLRSQGVTDVLLSIGYQGALIREFAGDGEQWNMNITYSDEGSKLRGTAGALRLALDEDRLRERFLLLYGDSYLPARIAPVWNAASSTAKPVLMTVFRNAGRWEKSNVIYRNGTIALYDKNPSKAKREAMHHVDYGLSVLHRDVIRDMTSPGEKADLAPILHTLSLEERLAGFEVTERFYEIGSPQGLADLSSYLIKQALPPASWNPEHLTT